MVNFRFHIVSLIAVFLALGLGILTGSAVVNQATVKAIKREISDVREEVNSLRNANGDLRSDVDRSNAFMADAANYTVDGRLVNVPVVVFAERNVAESVLDDEMDLLRAANADAPAIIWLEEKWNVANEQDLQALRDAADLLGGANSVRTRALDDLAARLADTPAPQVGAEPPASDLLQRLADAGFITIEGDVDLTIFPSGPSRALIVTGTDSRFAGTQFTAELTGAAVNAGIPTAVAEVFVQKSGEDAPQRGDAIAPVRSDAELGPAVSTIDDLDLVQGRVASVLALQDLGTGVVGHYGYGDGSTSSLPPHPEQQ